MTLRSPLVWSMLSPCPSSRGVLRVVPMPGESSDGHAWSTLLPCKAGPAVAVCYPPSGPGLVLVSPAPAVNVGATDFASQGFGGSKRGTASRIPVSGGTGLSPSELFLSRVRCFYILWYFLSCLVYLINSIICLTYRPVGCCLPRNSRVRRCTRMKR